MSLTRIYDNPRSVRHLIGYSGKLGLAHFAFRCTSEPILPSSLIVFGIRCDLFGTLGLYELTRYAC